MSNRHVQLPIPYATYQIDSQLATPSYQRWLEDCLAGRAQWEDKPVDDSLEQVEGVICLVLQGGDLRYCWPLAGELLDSYRAATTPEPGVGDLYTRAEMVIRVERLGEVVTVKKACHWVGTRDRPLNCLQLGGAPLTGELPLTGILELYYQSHDERTWRAEWMIVAGDSFWSLQSVLAAPIVNMTNRPHLREIIAEHVVDDYRPPSGDVKCELWSTYAGPADHYVPDEDGSWRLLQADEPLPPLEAVYLFYPGMWERLSNRPALVVMTSLVAQQFPDLTGYQRVYRHRAGEVYLRNSTAKSARSAEAR